MGSNFNDKFDEYRKKWGRWNHGIQVSGLDYGDGSRQGGCSKDELALLKGYSSGEILSLLNLHMPRRAHLHKLNSLRGIQSSLESEEGALPPRKNLTRYIKWPKSIRLQRQKRILKQRLKVPPTLNQFTKTILLKYRPEDKAAKKERLLNKAQSEAEGKPVESNKPIAVKYGLNHVTYLIEQLSAGFLSETQDVDPIELVVWLPSLCRKMEVPYCIIKRKSRLGAIVHQKTAACLCLTTVKNEDKLEFRKVLETIKANFNDKNDEYRKKWGGGIMAWDQSIRPRLKAKERVLGF
ncbi:hypothetical protein Bca52824_012451 [Brassica carinata]|uniref:60S ribosomal protein L7a n=1 Tax=Brassica carinata TaxID=52824 RepID=A0A8X8B2D6_BRACI|nr:hypothetical protein Bca52824_012451 [Brassica carinata]